MDPRYHYFFAVKLPKEAKQILKRWVEMNKERYPFKRWVHYEDYHITLAFLGFAEQSMLKQIIMQVHETLTGVDPFKLTIDQLGTFGKKTNPRIFWAGVHHSDSLCSIQKKVYNQCIRTGFELDRKPFRPHITLARKWNGEEPFNDKTLTSITIEGNSVTFQVEEIVLYETHLNQIPKYHEFYCFSLK